MVASPDVFAHPGFVRFWVAETVSGFGTYITTIAIQVLVVLTLNGSAADVGFVNAARWLPYLVLGLVVGALVDRRRRRPVLVVTDLGRSVVLGAIPLLWFLDRLTLPLLVGVMVVFGTLTLLNDAATQSFLPRLVPRSALLAANARLDQSASVAQTSGPVVGGALVTVLGAPLAVLVDAVSFLVSGVLTATVKVTETVMPRDGKLHLGREIRDGLAWVYGHRVLAPFAITTHAWFLFHSALTTVFVPYALIGLGLSAVELGVVLTAAGVGGLVGSLGATRIGMRWGVGRTVIGTQILIAIAWAVIVLAPGREEAHLLALVVVAGGQFCYGIAMGVSNANEMAYRQAVTPDALQGRMNTTMRSVNRAMIVVGAPTGGLLADAIGFRPVLWIGVGGLLLVALALALSPFRHAVHGDAESLRASA